MLQYPHTPSSTTTSHTSPPDYGGSPSSQPDARPENGDDKPRTKQKRNKPTLSCQACVDRKTKCDRGRPTCIACLKRSSICQYTEIAEILASSLSPKTKKAQKVQTNGGNAEKCSIANITHPDAADHPTATSVSPPQTSYPLKKSRPARTPIGLSSLSMPNNAAINIFGEGNEHPFANYWTCTGGIKEVVEVLPTKEQADILIAKYFEIVDPIYPIIDRSEFLEEYSRFWSSSKDEQCKIDAAIIALHFVLYAIATQYIELPGKRELAKTAEFYISAAHQALRISSYMNHITVPTVQAMVLTFYFLINDNHVSDAWTIVGLTVRQACVLQLNRDPEAVAPDVPTAEKQMRCKLWQAVMFQDNGISLFLKLAPSALIADVGPDSIPYDDNEDRAYFNLAMAHASPGDPITPLPPDVHRNDIAYVKSMWTYSNFLQEHVVIPRSLGKPLAKNPQYQQNLIGRYRDLYKSFPRPFGSYDPNRFFVANQRLARQQMACTCTIFHAMMLITSDENPEGGVTSDIFATLEATHEALGAFFAMVKVFGSEVNGWWAYQHRAFEAAIAAANMLASTERLIVLVGASPDMGIRQGLATAKGDVERMLEIISQSRGYFEFQSVQERRFDTLDRIYQTITIV